MALTCILYWQFVQLHFTVNENALNCIVAFADTVQFFILIQ